MAALVKAIDNYTPTQKGENNHQEYTWSNNIQEKIVQFHMQVVRTNADKVNDLSIKLNEILTTIITDHNTGKISKKEKIDMLSIMYKMIGFTRDIIDGKGEYSLTYMMIYEWYKFYPNLSKLALKLCVSSYQHPYGSWKDIKYFCNYCEMKTKQIGHDLIKYAIMITNDQLKMDIESLTPTLLAKWIPREKSKKFGWLFQELALDYFKQYMLSAKNPDKIKCAMKKCFTEYRAICSGLNRKLDTVQIKQCSHKWRDIDPTKQTSITMHKQKSAFLNKNKNGMQHSTHPDRIECAEHFKEYIEKAVKGEVKVKGKCIGMNDFTKNALRLNTNLNKDEINLLNAQWQDNSSYTGSLENMIAMVDTSGSMFGEPFHAAAALGIRVAEKSLLGKRVLSFATKASWINLDPYDNFVDMVHTLYKTSLYAGMSTNIYAAFDLILQAAKQQKLPASKVNNMIFAIFSDMQINEADQKFYSLYDGIENKYAEAGIQICGEPYKLPHLLFWNLKSTDGFPTLSSQKNTSCMSGFSPSLLNLFCQQGLDALKDCTPWNLLLTSLSNSRYQVMEDHVKLYLL
jgi:hypothetical protein